MNPSIRRSLLFASVLGAAPLARAVVYNWTGTTDSAFATNSNWLGGTAPAGGVDRVNFQTSTPNAAVFSTGSIFLNPISDRGLVVGSTGNATFTISGGSFTTQGGGDDVVGHGFTGVLNVSGGTYTANTALSLGLTNQAGSSATLNVSGTGVLNLANLKMLGLASTVNLSGGTLGINALTIGTNTETFNFNGGTLKAGGSFTFGGLNNVNVQAGGAVLDPNGNTLTVTQVLPGAGGLTLAGSSGTVSLGAANTFAGTTTVNASGTTLALANVSALQNSTLSKGAGAVTFTVAGANTYNLGGLSGSAPLDIGANSLSVGTNGASTTFSGALGVTSATGGLTKVGSGELILSGANIHEGNTVVSAGVLTAGGNAALGTGAGTTSVSSGAALRLANGVTVTGESVTIAGSGTDSNGALHAAAGATATWAGPVTLGDATARLGAGAGGSLTVSGAVQGSGANQTLNVGAGVGGSGTVTLSAASGVNTYTGPTAIVRGTLRIGANDALPTGTVLDVDSTSAAETAAFDLNGFNQTVAALQRSGSGSGAGGSSVTNSGASPRTLTVNQSGTTAYDGILSGANLAITKSGPGTLTLSGANTHGGATQVTGSGSTLVVGSNSALGSTAGGSTVGSGAILRLANGITVTGESVTVAGSGFDSNGALQAAAGASATWAGPVILGDANARVGAGSGGSLTISGAVQGSGANQTLLVGGGAGGAAGTVTLSAAGGVNTYTGPTAIVRGVLRIGANDSLPTGTVLDVDFSSAAENATFDLNGFNQTVAGLQRSGSGLGAGGGIVTNTGASPGTLTVSQSTATTFNGVLSGANFALAKTGSGTLTLSGGNTYGGLTTISGGSIKAGAAAALGATTTGTTVSSGGTFDFNGVALNAEPFTLAGGKLTNTGATQINATGGAITVTANSQVGGANRWDLRSSGSLVVDPGATLAKEDANLVAVVGRPVTNNGGVQVNAGVFALHVVAVHGGSGSYSVASGGELQLGSFNSSLTLSLPNAVSSSGGTLSSVDATGPGGAPVFSGPVTLASGTTTFRADQAGRISGAIGGSGVLAKTGADTLALSGNNTHTGTTAVNTGAILLQHANALGSVAAGTTVAAGASVQLQGGISYAAEPVTLTMMNSATSTSQLRNLSGNNVWNGPVTMTTGSGAQVVRVGSDQDTLTIAGNVTLSSLPTTQFVLQGNGDVNVTGVISGAAAVTSSVNGTGVRTLSADNTFTGAVNVNGAVLSVPKVLNPGSPQPLGPGATPVTMQDTSTLRYTGAGLGQTSRDFSLVGATTSLDVSGATGTLRLDGTLSGSPSVLQKLGAGTLNLTATANLNGARVVAGTWRQTAGTTTLTSVSTGLTVDSGAAYSLEGGTLRADAVTIQTGGSFTWGAGALMARSTQGSAGSTDFTSAGYTVVRSGTTIAFNGDLDSGSGSILGLHGSPSFYLNNGVRFTALQVNGNLDLTDAGDQLRVEINPYLLRPFSPNLGSSATDSGSLPLVAVTGNLTGAFDTFGTVANDGLGFSQHLGAFTNAASLPVNTWYLEYAQNVVDPAGFAPGTYDLVLFHYRVAGYVPEPGGFGLLALGALSLRHWRRFRLTAAEAPTARRRY